jgi:hypothetical protein
LKQLSVIENKIVDLLFGTVGNRHIPFLVYKQALDRPPGAKKKTSGSLILSSAGGLTFQYHGQPSV